MSGNTAKAVNQAMEAAGQVPGCELLTCQALKYVATVVGEHRPVDDVGEVTPEAANRLAPGLAFGPTSGEVRLCWRVGPGLDEGYEVQRPVELPVAAAVEAMALRLAR